MRQEMNQQMIWQKLECLVDTCVRIGKNLKKFMVKMSGYIMDTMPSKKEHKRKGWYKTINLWTTQKADKSRLGNVGLSKYLIEWNIGHSIAFRYERNQLNVRQWGIICGFRHGHIELNGQRKYGVTNIFCDNIDCNMITEDMLHFIFDCSKYEQE
eukprot:13365_1